MIEKNMKTKPILAYTNDHYHFSFSYPAGLTYGDMEHSPELQKNEITTDTSVGHTVSGTTIAKDALAEVVNDGVGITIQKRENKNANAFPASLQGDQGPAPMKREETMVGEMYAVHYVDSGSAFSEQGETQAVNETYVVEKDGYVYTIGTFGTDPTYRDVLKGIIDSFSFSGTGSFDASAPKRYENAKYGFSLDIPKDFWFEENANLWPIGPIFALEIEHPKLKPEEVGHPDGTTTMTKYGQLVDVFVCDHLKRSCVSNGRPNGLMSDHQTTAVVGGLPAEKFDDKAYFVVTKQYEYTFQLHPSSQIDSLSTSDRAEMKQAFEDIVLSGRVCQTR